MHIYAWPIGGSHSLLHTIPDSSGDDKWGYYLDMTPDGQTVAFSAYGSDVSGTNRGHVEVWDANDATGTSWTQRGFDIPGADAGNSAGKRGVHLSADGQRVVFAEPEGDADSLVARVFDWSSGSWDEKAGIAKSLTNQVEWMRLQLSADGSRLALASIYVSTGIEQVIVFDYDATNNAWNTVGSPMTGPNTQGNGLGRDMAMKPDGTVLAMGARSANSAAGGVWVYAWDGADWAEVGSVLMTGNVGESHYLGSGLVMTSDGRKLVVGANGGSSAGNEIATFQAVSYPSSPPPPTR